MRLELIKARRKKEWTQKQLAERVNVSEQMIGHLETGRRDGSAKLRDKIAKALRVSQRSLWHQQETTRQGD